MDSEISSPRKGGGLFLGFFYEEDAASGAGGDWRRDPDGGDDDAGAEELAVIKLWRVVADLSYRWKADEAARCGAVCSCRS